MSTPELDSFISERINQPLVQRAFDEWKSRGLLDETQIFLSTLDSEQQPPIVHSFITHVHKEKGLFLDLIGEDVGIGRDVRRALAMSADMLWAFSLMVDDVEDRDVSRGGLQTCWVKYGTDSTLNSTKAGVIGLCKYLVERTGIPALPRSCIAYLNIGLTSIGEHRFMDLETPVGELVRNYERRCDFHGTFPLVVFAQLADPRQHSQINHAIAGLRLFNQAGQLINDLKDFVGGDLYGRSFSDIRRGVPTVPLKYFYQRLNHSDQIDFKAIYGKGCISESDRKFLDKTVKSSEVEVAVVHRVEDVYRQSLDCLSQVVTPGNICWFSDWAEYKVNHLKQSIKHE